MLMGGRCLSLKSAIGLSRLPIMTSVCPASNGEQAIAKVGRHGALHNCSSMHGLQGEGRGLYATATRRYYTLRRKRPDSS